MRNRRRLVPIVRLPAPGDEVRRQADLDDLESCINTNRPAVVIDCSALHVFDRGSLHLLLCCLEEAMKRNGDIRLAALCPEARSALSSAGVNSLFHCFETVEEAVDSYDRPPWDLASLERPQVVERESEMNAA